MILFMNLTFLADTAQYNQHSTGWLPVFLEDANRDISKRDGLNKNLTSTGYCLFGHHVHTLLSDTIFVSDVCTNLVQLCPCYASMFLLLLFFLISLFQPHEFLCALLCLCTLPPESLLSNCPIPLHVIELRQWTGKWFGWRHCNSKEMIAWSSWGQ